MSRAVPKTYNQQEKGGEAPGRRRISHVNNEQSIGAGVGAQGTGLGPEENQDKQRKLLCKPKLKMTPTKAVQGRGGPPVLGGHSIGWLASNGEGGAGSLV